MRERALAYSRARGRIKGRAKEKKDEKCQKTLNEERLKTSAMTMSMRACDGDGYKGYPVPKERTKARNRQKKTCCVNRASITSPSEHDIVEIVV